MGVEGVSFDGDITSSSVAIRVDLALSTSAAEKVSSLLSSGQSEGLAVLAEDAGVALSLGVDLARTESALRAAGCPALANPIANALQRIPWQPVPRSLHLAGSQFEVDELSGDFAVEITMDNSGFIQSLLGKIPGRSWLESSKTIVGEKVKKLSIPTMSSLYYQLQDTQFRFANHEERNDEHDSFAKGSARPSGKRFSEARKHSSACRFTEPDSPARFCRIRDPETV